MHINLNKIDGSEELNELPSPLIAVIKFYSAFNNSDMSLMKSNWLNSQDVKMYNPIGGITVGWKNIMEKYNSIFQSKVYVYFYDFTFFEQDDIFVIIGQENGTFELNNSKLKLKVRTSRIFQKVGDQWFQIHHHGSIDDPKLLDIYQKSAMGLNK